MLPSPPKAQLAIVALLETERESSAIRSAGNLERAASEIKRIADRLHVPMTWAVADPPRSFVAEWFAPGAPSRHELAVQANVAWAGAGAGESRFEREISRRLLGAQAAGMEARTFVLGKLPLPTKLWTLAQRGVLAVIGQETGTPRLQRPRLLNHGVWQIPVAAELPGASWWWPGGGGLVRALHAVRETVAEERSTAIQLNVERVAALGMAALKNVERLLAAVARRAGDGRLALATAGQLAESLVHGRARKPQHSILRAA